MNDNLTDRKNVMYVSTLSYSITYIKPIYLFIKQRFLCRPNGRIIYSLENFPLQFHCSSMVGVSLCFKILNGRRRNLFSSLYVRPIGELISTF